MFTNHTPTAIARRSSVMNIMKIVDRVGLSLLYALVAAGLPFTALGVLSGTI